VLWASVRRRAASDLPGEPGGQPFDIIEVTRVNSDAAMFGELVRYRGLLGMLAWRDIRVRYKQSLLGVAWAFLMPLIQTAVMVIVFQSGAIEVKKDGLHGMPYILFVLTGVIPWTLFNATIASSLESLTRNSRLVTKIYFPREVFPLANVLGALVDFGIAMVVFTPIYIFYIVTTPEVSASPMLLLYPVFIVVQVMFVAGLSMLLSMANLFFRDVKYIMTFVLQLWFFATNVVYPITFAQRPHLEWITYLNPMIPLLNAYRDCLQGQGWVHSSPAGMLSAVVVSVAMFFVGWRVFHKASFKFAEYV
jgi:ABC-type polysaccharide/polyol phosphate export permease